jgi:CRISPR-associated protein Csm2
MGYNNNRSGGYNKPKPQLPADINEETIKNIIVGNDAELIVEKSKFLGEFFNEENIYGRNKTLTTSKIRNIFDSLKKLEMKWKGQKTINELILLQPKLSYSAHRDQTPASVKHFVEILLWGLKSVISKKDNENELNRCFKNFCKFYEAILCYHKANGGK